MYKMSRPKNPGRKNNWIFKSFQGHNTPVVCQPFELEPRHRRLVRPPTFQRLAEASGNNQSAHSSWHGRRGGRGGGPGTIFYKTIFTVMQLL